MRQRTIKTLLKKKNVVSVGRGKKKVNGVTTDFDAVVVGVYKKVPISQLSKKDIVPEIVDGEITDVIEVGEIKLLSDHIAKHRPCPAGVSIGHYQITAGTLGAWVKKHDVWMILSNNHVLANLNEAEIGDAIIQPGAYDGGEPPADIIGYLFSYCPLSIISASNCPIARAVAWGINLIAQLLHRKTRLVPMASGVANKVDCALARPVNDAVVLPEVLDIGEIKGEAELYVGQRVKKSGRTSGVTFGKVIQIDVTATVQMGEGKTAIFDDQVMIQSEFSQPGDSGSAVLTMEDALAGLLFAGSEEVTLVNRYSNVKETLGIDSMK